MSAGAGPILHRSSLSGRCFDGIHAVFPVTTTGTDSPVRRLSFVPRSFSAMFEFDALKADAGYASFTVATQFDFTVREAFDATPILAVLTNLVSRGVPTRASLVAERAVRDAYGITAETVMNGTISFPATGTVPEDIGKEIRRIGVETAWIEKSLLETLLAGRLSLLEDRWRILVLGCHPLSGRIAAADLGEQFTHLAKLSRDYDRMRLPEIVILNRGDGEGHDCHLVMDIDIGQPFRDDGVRFPGHRLDPRHKGNAFHIRRKAGTPVRPTFLTTERIVYKPCSRPDGGKGHADIPEHVAHLAYFLQLIMRKETFRDGQVPILSRALQLQSVIGLLPTGGGKSLTYQLAALLQPGVAMVIDPLNSLMVDQIKGLKNNKIDCCSFMNSHQDAKRKQETIEDLTEGRCLFFFASPERLTIRKFRDNMQAMSSASVYFSYGIVDEVHCVSEWGHDFRTSYLHLGRNLRRCLRPSESKRYPSRHVSLLGLTATASFDVLSDVERELAGGDAFPLTPEATIRHESTDRLELQYYVHDCDGANVWGSKWRAEDEKNALLPDIVGTLHEKMRELQSRASIDLIKRRFIERENIHDATRLERLSRSDLTVDVADDWHRHPDSPTSAIVFCPFRQGSIGIDGRTSNGHVRPGVAETLRKGLRIDHGISRFHGGDGSPRQEQDNFVDGQTNIMVATKAFGMGIDKPNVRFIVHMSHAGSLEAYIQEAGRGGRDGRMALSVILYNPNSVPHDGRTSTPDAAIYRYFQENAFKGPLHEKAFLHCFLSRSLFSDHGPGDDDPGGTVSFLDALSRRGIGDAVRLTLSWDISGGEALRSRDSFNDYVRRRVLPDGQPPGHGSLEISTSEDYCALVEKAVYRLCCIGAVDDYTKDWGDMTITVHATAKAEGAYYAGLESFLLRYHSPRRAKEEVAKARDHQGENELQRCLGYLVEFVYDKIVGKRRRAIDDMETFCRLAVRSTKPWTETNEDLKDFIYYYFNSKFARDVFETDSGEPFSLTTDTCRGNLFDPDILFKYMRVADDDVVGASSQMDNVKHLLGATRLIRRGMTDTNGVIDLLNAFCLLFLGTSDSPVLRDELEESYVSGYRDARARIGDDAAFHGVIDRFERELSGRGLLTEATRRTLHGLGAAAELAVHAEWLKAYAGTGLP